MRYATIDYNYIDDPTLRTADVAIVPDDYFADEDAEIDNRIFFYFTETEFHKATNRVPVEGLEFNLIQIHDEEEN